MKNMNENEKISLFVSEDGNVDSHEHNFLELVYVLKGGAKQTIKGKKTLLKKGDYFIIDYNTLHGYECAEGKSFLIVNCLFLPGFIDKTLGHCRKFSEVMENYLIRCNKGPTTVNPANRIFSDEDGEVERLIKKMRLEFCRKGSGYLEILRCLLIQIIILTMRKIQNENAPVADSTEKYISDYVAENYMNKIRLADIASELNYSVPYISKLFHEKYGITFEKYLQRTRVEQSCRLLANTDKKIIEIAECVGYSDLKFFNMLFKKSMGMSPREYRKLHR